MTPRRRQSNRDLPPNLYFTTRPQGRYYYYRRPDTGKRTSFGYDKAAAIDAANQLNQVFGAGRSLVAKAMRGQADQITLGEYILHYTAQVLPQRRINGHRLSTEYVREATRILARIEDSLGTDTRLAAITQAQIAAHLTRCSTAEASNQHRKHLRLLYKHAVSDGLVPDNIPDRIIRRDPAVRTRHRLTLDQYSAIFAQASPAIQNAMELSLNALQRRSDIQKWRFADQVDGYALVIQSKTHKHGPSAYLRIPLSLPVAHSELGHTTLDGIIGQCRDRIACPFLIHQRPRRVKKSREKDHPFQLSRKEISDGFATARDATGLFADLAPAEKPTFHELLALGEWLREKQGWTAGEIQQLRGHASERMTRVYLEGHEWTTVQVPVGIKKAR